MQPLVVATTVFAGCLVAGLAGLLLRPRLTERHLDSESRAVVTNITGLIAAMSALLLGLLVANAQSAYNTVSDEVDQMAANLVELDRTLSAFGPAAADARALLRRVAATEIDRIWPPEVGKSSPDALAPASMDQARLQFGIMVGGLPTQTEAQRSLQRHIFDLLWANTRTRVLVFNQVTTSCRCPS